MQQFQRQIIDWDTRLYHSRVKLTEKRIEAASKGTPPSDNDDAFGVGVSLGLASTVIDPNAVVENPLLEAVLEIPGVESSAVTPYVLMVKRSKAFDWGDIETALLKLLHSFHLALEDSKIGDK